jgi:hypothetical protein
MKKILNQRRLGFSKEAEAAMSNDQMAPEMR